MFIGRDKVHRKPIKGNSKRDLLKKSKDYIKRFKQKLQLLTMKRIRMTEIETK